MKNSPLQSHELSPLLKRLLAIVLLIGICQSVYSRIAQTHTYGLDFFVYILAAFKATHGIAIYRPEHMPFIYPPFSLLLFIPFLSFSTEVTARAWVGISLVSLYLSVHLVSRLLFKDHPLYVRLLIFYYCLQTFTVNQTLFLGQINLVVLLFVTVLIWLVTKDKNGSRRLQVMLGTVCAMAVSLKISPGIVLLYCVFKRYWVALITCLVCFFLFNYLTIQSLGLSHENIIYNINHLIEQLSVVSNGYDYGPAEGQLNQSVSSLVQTYFGEMWVKPLGLIFLIGGSIAVLIKRFYLKSIHSHHLDWECVSLLVAIATFSIGAYSWEHHLVFVFPLLWVHMAKMYAGKISKARVFIYAFVLTSFLINPFSARFIWEYENNLLLTPFLRYHGLFSFLLLFGLYMAQTKKSFGVLTTKFRS